jgi:hypothetical protein
MDEELTILMEMNKTELLLCAEAQGLGTLSRSLSIERLVALVHGAEEPGDDDYCGSTMLRQATRAFVEAYRDRVTLPLSTGGKVCSGDCLNYGCPSAIAINCSKALKS